jgi:uncharacterized protein YifN (PemK superfamily)
MIIRTPIYYVVVQGNLKHIISELPHVIIVTYEEHIDKTFVVVKASEKDETEKVLDYFYRLHDDLIKDKKKYKQEQVEVKYSKNGINFKTIEL